MKASVFNTWIIKAIIKAYYLASRQKVNQNKSSIKFSPKIKIHIKNNINDELGVDEQDGFWRYLGVPITGKKLSCAEG